MSAADTPGRPTGKTLALALALLTVVLAGAATLPTLTAPFSQAPDPTQAPAPVDAAQAQQLLADLVVADPDPGAGYDRAELFGQDWAPVGDCDTRAVVLARDLLAARYSTRTPCLVIGGTLSDPYTGTTVTYEPGAGRIEVDHVVSLYNAWISGAQTWDPATRAAFANDTTNLLAVSAAANQDKGGSDAATWTPSNPVAWCGYATVQITVKDAYHLRVTTAEKAALLDLLQTC
jgi:hypothetical protein